VKPTKGEWKLVLKTKTDGGLEVPQPADVQPGGVSPGGTGVASHDVANEGATKKRDEGGTRDVESVRLPPLIACSVAAVVMFFLGLVSADGPAFWWALAKLALLWPLVSAVRWMWLNPLF